MKKFLVVVDMQKDFVDGALGTPEAEAIVPAVLEKVRRFEGDIFVTYDTHFEDYLDTPEGKKLPVPHCIYETPGWQLTEPLEELMDVLLQYFNWFNYENQDDYMNVELYERFHRVLAYCVDNYNQKITVSQLAAMENINRNYFSQFIGKTIFSSFSNMVNYIRCWHAEDLLLTTDMPNAEISYACGFSDPKYFYAAFKDLWGCTPSEHRQQYEEYYQECLRDPVNKKHETTLDDAGAASILKDFIIQWHLF